MSILHSDLHICLLDLDAGLKSLLVCDWKGGEAFMEFQSGLEKAHP